MRAAVNIQSELPQDTNNDDDDERSEQAEEQPPQEEENEQLNNDGLIEEEEEQVSLPVMKAMSKYWKSEFKQLFTLCWPLIVSNICNALLGATDVAFLGRLGQNNLAAASLGNAYTNTVYFIAIGLLSAQDTLISQAEGSKNHRMKIVVLFRSFLIVNVIAIPIFIFCMFPEQVLRLIGQSEEIIPLSTVFIRYSAMGLFPLILINILSRYLVAQSVVIVPMVTGVASVVLNGLLNYLLIHGIGFTSLGFIGAPIATTLTRTFIASCLLVFVIMYERRRKIENVSESLSFRAFIRGVLSPSGLVEYLKLGIPGSLHMCLELWAFTITNAVVGLLGPKYLASQSVMSSITFVAYTIALAISIAVSIRVGTCLGAKHPSGAKVVSILGTGLCFTFAIINASQTVLLRRYYVQIFTKESEIIEYTSLVIPIMCGFQIFDYTQTCLQGIIRGTGRQTIGAILNFIAFYILGLPIGYLLAFKFKLALKGIWIGMLSSMFIITSILFAYVVLSINFNSEVNRALDRVAKSDIQPNETIGKETPADDNPLEMDDVAAVESTDQDLSSITTSPIE